MNFLKALYLNNRFFYSVAAIILLFVLAYIVPFFFLVAQISLVLFAAVLFYDIFIVFAPNRGVKADRLCADRFSNGDENTIEIVVQNQYPLFIKIKIIDEVPFQFQKRDVKFLADIKAGETRVINYSLRPVERGVYHFGVVRVFVRSGIGLITRRFNCDAEKEIKVYPSFLQIQKYELMAISDHLVEIGIKKVRKIGHNIEFEHIKEYVEGDDIRTINWKATARKSELMVNLYQDEKSQNVYSLIDKGRVMKMPFEGMTLLDYAINSSLVFSNVAIKKEDKAGILTFEKVFDGYLPSSKKKNQMQMILDFLYNLETTFGESDYSNLFVQVKNRIRQRSLLLLYTNFESIHSLQRQLPYFQKLSRSHLLVVIFFVNTELHELINQKPDDTLGIYQKVIAEQYAYEKQQIVKTLRMHGIQSILAKPQDLSVKVINKYIELKARQMI